MLGGEWAGLELTDPLPLYQKSVENQDRGLAFSKTWQKEETHAITYRHNYLIKYAHFDKMLFRKVCFYQ